MRYLMPDLSVRIFSGDDSQMNAARVLRLVHRAFEQGHATAAHSGGSNNIVFRRLRPSADYSRST
jgi:hypothetical protein